MAVASFDQNSKVAGHVHLFGHPMNFENVEVVGFESNYHELLWTPGGGGDSNMEQTGMLVGNFEFNP